MNKLSIVNSIYVVYIDKSLTLNSIGVLLTLCLHKWANSAGQLNQTFYALQMPSFHHHKKRLPPRPSNYKPTALPTELRMQRGKMGHLSLKYILFVKKKDRQVNTYSLF